MQALSGIRLSTVSEPSLKHTTHEQTINRFNNCHKKALSFLNMIVVGRGGGGGQLDSDVLMKTSRWSILFDGAVTLLKKNFFCLLLLLMLLALFV